MSASNESQSKIEPSVLAALLCDTVIIEAGTSKKTLVGLFDEVFGTFPTEQRFGVYVKLMGAQGRYRLRLDYASRDSNQVFQTHQIGETQIRGSVGAADWVSVLTTVIPAAGAYEFRVYVNDVFITHIDFSALEK